MPFSKHDHVLQAVTSNGSDQPLHVGPLPWAGRRREDLLHAHALDSMVKLTPIDLVPISRQVTWCGIFGKGLDHLLSGPPKGAQIRESTTQNNRSFLFSLGTPFLLFSTLSCCRRDRFSRAKSVRSLTAAITRTPSHPRASIMGSRRRGHAYLLQCPHAL